jgi:hypothetical protein
MTIKEDLLRAAAYLEAADDDSASMSGDEADRIAGVLREMAARAVPLVAEAPREPTRVLPHPGSPEASAMMDSLLAEYNYPANTKNAARAGWEAANRWLAAPPVSLAPMPEDRMQEAVSVDPEDLILKCVPGGDCCDPQQVADAIRGYFATVRAALLSHLRTAPRPTLSDEHRQMLGEIEQEFVALPDLAAWIRRLQDRLREALASARADALLRELVVSIEEYEKVECIDVGRVRRKRRDAAFAKAQAYARGAPETDRAAMTSTTAKE